MRHLTTDGKIALALAVAIIVGVFLGGYTVGIVAEKMSAENRDMAIDESRCVMLHELRDNP